MDGRDSEGYAGGNMKAGAVREGRAGVTVHQFATAIGTNVVRHVYDGMHVVADTDVDGNLLRSYTWGPGIDNLLSITVYPISTNSTASTFNALTDHLGTVHALVTTNGTVAERYEYDARGNVLGVFDGNGGSLPSSVHGLRYLFQGREYSWAVHEAWGGAGLYNFRARYYDPSTGRWLSNDPIGISGGLNQYAFCANNPVNFVDPEGLFNQLTVLIPYAVFATQAVRVMMLHNWQVADASMALYPGGEGVWISTAYTQLIDELFRTIGALAPNQSSAVYVYVDSCHKVRVEWSRPHPSQKG